MKGGWLALLTALVAGLTWTAARADYNGRVTGNWIGTAQSDRFGDGGRFFAVAVVRGYGFGVRCLDKEFSYAMVLTNEKVRQKALYKFKFRVDDGKIYLGNGFAIADNIVQIAADPALVKDIIAGKELAVRDEVDSVSSTHIVKLRGSDKALVDIVKNCPLDKQAVPKFDEDGVIDPDSLKK